MIWKLLTFELNFNYLRWCFQLEWIDSINWLSLSIYITRYSKRALSIKHWKNCSNWSFEVSLRMVSRTNHLTSIIEYLDEKVNVFLLWKNFQSSIIDLIKQKFYKKMTFASNSNMLCLHCFICLIVYYVITYVLLIHLYCLGFKSKYRFFYNKNLLWVKAFGMALFKTFF